MHRPTSSILEAAAGPRLSHEGLLSLLAASPVPIMALDLAGHVVLWSGAAERVFGWTADEAIGYPLRIVPDDKLEEFKALSRIVYEGANLRSVVTERVARDGRRVHVSISTAPLLDDEGETRGMLAVVTDLTEQDALREALELSELRFATAFDASPMPKLLVRMTDRRIVEVNRAYLELSGATRDEIVGRAPDDPLVMSVGPSPADRARLWGMVAAHGRVRDFEYTFRTRDGRFGEATASAEPTSIGGEPYLLLVVQDVTEKKRTERARQENEARFRQLAETIQEVFWLRDCDTGRIAYVSPAYEKIWGRPCERLYENPKDWLTAVHPDDRDRIWAAARVKQAKGAYDEEFRILRPDGAVSWIRARAFPVRDEDGRVVRIAGSAQDVTERRALEEQVRQTQKMESIGLLAGGVAHDFNNLLTVITSNCSLLESLSPSVGESAELLREVREASERAVGLTRQLLAFSRRETLATRVVDFREIVVDTERMLRRILGEDITLVITSSPEPLMVEVDPGSWVQVLMNLAVNARDAMPRGGTLAVETHEMTVDADFARTHPRVHPGPYVALVVRDSGCGMSDQVSSRIFEPFFTTKEVGEGTGLGLSVVHGIVAQSGGDIEVESVPGEGTTFRAYLPKLRAARPDDAPMVTRTADVRGSETILLVEDDPAIRRVAVRVLTRLGYTIMEAADGVEALDLARRSPKNADLLVTDVVMPRMNGRDLANALQARSPGLRVLFTSGYTDGALARHGVRFEEVAFLPKPYGPTMLAQSVRKALTRKG